MPVAKKDLEQTNLFHSTIPFFSYDNPSLLVSPRLVRNKSSLFWMIAWSCHFCTATTDSAVICVAAEAVGGGGDLVLADISPLR